MNKKIVSLLLRISITAGAIALLLYFMRGHLGESLEIIFHHTKWSYFFIGAFIYLLSLSAISFRLVSVLKVKSIHLSFFKALRVSFIGLFYNLFLPSAVGGDIAKAYFIGESTGKRASSYSAVFVDRFLGLLMLIFMALFALLFFQGEIQSSKIKLIVWFMAGLFFIAVTLFFSRRVSSLLLSLLKKLPDVYLVRKLIALYEETHSFRYHYEAIIQALGWSFFSQSFYIIMHFFMALSLGHNVPIVPFFLFVPIVILVSMAPSLGGLGVREAANVYLFSFYLPRETAFAFSILIDFVFYGFSFIGGLLYMVTGGKLNLQKEKESIGNDS